MLHELYDENEFQSWLKTAYVPITGGDGDKDAAAMEAGAKNGASDDAVSASDGGDEEPFWSDQDFGAEPSTVEDGEEGVDEAAATAAADSKKPYTLKEMQNLDFEKIDTSRIPTEYQPFYKSMQTAFTRATQQTADLRKTLESEIGRVRGATAGPTDPVEQVFQAFIADPHKVRTDIQSSIASLHNQHLEALARFDNVKAAELAKQAQYLEGTLNQFEGRRNTALEFNNYNLNLTRATEAGVVQDIPNIREVAQPMNEFLVQEHGVDQRLVNILTNGAVLDMLLKGVGITDIDGPTAVRQLYRFIHSQYNKKALAQKAEGNVDKTAPKTVKTSGTPPARHVNSQGRGAAFKEAQETGDWQKYFEKFPG